MQPPIWAQRLSEKLTKGVQGRIARKIGVGTDTLSKYKTGQRRPDPDTLIDLCVALNVSPEWLFGFTEEERPLAVNESRIRERRRPCQFRCPHCGHDLVVTVRNGRRKSKEVPDGRPAPVGFDI